MSPPSSSSSLLLFLLKARRVYLFRLLPSPFPEHRRPLSFFPYSTAAATPPPPPDSFTVQFLTANCDLPLADAVLAARSFRISESATESPLAVLSLLRSHGFSSSHVCRLVSRRPGILLSRLERTVAPKLGFLSSFLPPTHLPAFLNANPSLIGRSLKGHIDPLFALLRSFLHSPDDLLQTARRYPQLLTCNLSATVAPNIALLSSLGVPASHIAKLLITHPRSFVQPAARFAEAVDIVTALGIRPDLSLFIYAVRAANGMRRSTWEDKVGVFRRFGWSEEEFRVAFQRAPLFVLVSEPKLRKMVEFLTKEIHFTASDVSRQPKLLMYSLENRLMPRYRVLRALKSKGLLMVKNTSTGSSLSLAMFTCSDATFMNTYVERHDKVAPELMDIYNDKVKVEGSSVKLSNVKVSRDKMI